MSKLLDLSNQVLAEKQTKILPENIKRGIQIFDVLGTYDPTTPEGPKLQLFSTAEEMNAAGGLSGDIALVYKNNFEAITSGDLNATIDVKLLDVITVPTAVTTTGLGSSVKIGTMNGVDLSMRLRKTACSIQAGMLSTLASYSSTDGITYTKTEGESELKSVIITSVSNENLMAFLRKIDFNFEGLYTYEDGWKYLDIGLDSLTPNTLREYTKGYGDNGIVEGDGTIYDYMSPKAIMSTLYGKDNITSTRNAFSGTLSSSNEIINCARTITEPTDKRYIAAGVAEHFTSMQPIKFVETIANPLFDKLQKYKRLSDNSDSFTFVSEDGEHGVNISDLTATVDSLPAITLPGSTEYSSLCCFLLSDYLYYFTHTNTTGYVTRISLIDGTYKTLTHTLSASNSIQYSSMQQIYDPDNNQIYFALYTDNGSTSYCDIYVMDLDFTSITKKKTLSIPAAACDGDMVLSTQNEILVEMETGTNYEVKLWVLNKDTFVEKTTCTYSWSTSGPLLMHSAMRNARLNPMAWHVGDKIFFTAYGDPAELDLSTSTFTRSSKNIDADKFPGYYDIEKNLTITYIYNTERVTNVYGDTVYIYKRAVYDYSEDLVTTEDIKYECSQMYCRSDVKEFISDSYMVPYFDGERYRRFDVSDIIHQCGWYENSSISDCDAILTPSIILSTEKYKDGIPLDDIHTIEYAITYNPSKTMSSVEYSTAIDTANQILGEEVTE